MQRYRRGTEDSQAAGHALNFRANGPGPRALGLRLARKCDGRLRSQSFGTWRRLSEPGSGESRKPALNEARGLGAFQQIGCQMMRPFPVRGQNIRHLNHAAPGAVGSFGTDLAVFEDQAPLWRDAQQRRWHGIVSRSAGQNTVRVTYGCVQHSCHNTPLKTCLNAWDRPDDMRPADRHA